MKTHTLLFVLIIGLFSLAGCSTPQSRIDRSPATFNRATPEQQALIREGRIDIGFDAELVRLAFGEPDRVVDRREAEGSSEVWYYTMGDRRSSVSIGFGFGSFGSRHSGVGIGVSRGFSLSDGERTTAIVTFRNGRVVTIDQEKQ